LAWLAEGLGIRATARVFEVDANTVLHWLAEAAEQLRAFPLIFCVIST
jgi:transposase-like protein